MSPFSAHLGLLLAAAIIYAIAFAIAHVRADYHGVDRLLVTLCLALTTALFALLAAPTLEVVGLQDPTAPVALAALAPLVYARIVRGRLNA